MSQPVYDEQLQSDDRQAREAFDRAMAANILSANPDADNFVGRFMFMGSGQRGDAFKHIITRQYVYHKFGSSMSQPIASETIEYEQYVDGLRQENSRMRAMLQTILGKADDLIAAIDGSTDQFEAETSALSEASSAAERLLESRIIPSAASARKIIVHIEGGMAADVSGIPPGVEVRVEDHDEGDTSHPSWDAEKGCFVTVYGGEVA